MLDQIKQFIKSLGADDSTTASIIVTLVVFLTGGVASVIYTAFKRYIERVNHRAVFCDLITRIAISSRKQGKYFQIAAESFDIKTGLPPKLQIVTIEHLQSIEKIDFKHFYDAYFYAWSFAKTKQMDIRRFDRVWAFIYSLKDIESKYYEDCKRYDDLRKEFNDKLNENLSVISNFHNQIVHETTNLKINDKRLFDCINAFDKIIYEWQQMPNHTANYVTNTYMVQPLLGWTREYRDISLVLELAPSLLQADLQYQSLVALMDFNKKLFDAYSLVYRRAWRIISFCAIRLKYPNYFWVVIDCVLLLGIIMNL